MAEYRLSPAAESDLERIWLYTRAQWGNEQSHRYIDHLINTFAALADAPQSATACDHIRAGYRCRRVERHMIYFRMESYGIAIIRVLHDRMDAEQHL